MALLWPGSASHPELRHHNLGRRAAPLELAPMLQQTGIPGWPAPAQFGRAFSFLSLAESTSYTSLLNITFPLKAIRRALHLHQLQPMILSNAPGMASNDDLIARSERRTGHTLLGQLRWRGPLDNPALYLSFFVWGLHSDEGMRIAPYELF